MEPKNSPYYLGNYDTLPTVLSLKHHSSVVNIELPWDANMTDLLDAFVGACVSVTFHQDGVIQAMKDYAEDHLIEEDL
jgi:hypothetical protein